MRLADAAAARREPAESGRLYRTFYGRRDKRRENIPRAYGVLALLRAIDATGYSLDLDDVTDERALSDAYAENLVHSGSGWSSLTDAVALTGRGQRMVKLNAGVSTYQQVQFPPSLRDRLAFLVGG